MEIKVKLALFAILAELTSIREAISAIQQSPDAASEDGWVSTSEAAASLGISSRQVRRIAAEQGLGSKNGGRWALRASELARLKRKTARSSSQRTGLARKYLKAIQTDIETDILATETDISDVSRPKEL